ncbi:MAG: hypothetical protein IAE80_18325 [Anaerolinea sp.]|nr:hypothetical protein [Anaerolinea sp.]
MPRKLLITLVVLVLLVLTVTVAQTQDAVTFTGWFTVIYGDPSPDSSQPPITIARLQDANGVTIAEFETDYATIFAYNRKQVEITGVVLDLPGLDSQLIDNAPTVQLTGIREIASAPAVEELTGSQPWVNLLCKFADITTTPKQPSAYADFFSTSYPGLDHFWRAISYNAINLTGSTTVSQWYTLPRNFSYYVQGENVNLDAIANDCANAANAAVFFPNFVGINFMLNATIGCCAWGGTHTLNIDGQVKTYRATWDPPWAQTHDVIGHEMGHGFGLPHSSGPADNPPTGLSIYVSSWDLMSNSGGTCAMSSTTVGCLGQGVIAYYVSTNDWIAPSRIAMVNPGVDTTITIDRLQEPINDTGTLFARVPIGGSSSLFYTVEVRDSSSGYDRNIPAQAVIIHKVDLSIGDSSNTGPALVVDAADGNDNVNDAGARWLPGESYIDPIQNIRIDVLSQVGSSFSVRIRNNVVVGTPVDLAAQISGSPNPYIPGGNVSFPFTVTNNSGVSATNAIALFDLPTDIAGVSVLSNPVGCSTTGTTMTCALGTIAGGGQANGTIVLRTTAGTTLALPMQISAYADQSDSNTSNNIASVVIGSVANDSAATAKVITSLNYTDTMSTGGATFINEPQPSCPTDIGNTVWYRYTAPAAQTIQINTQNSNFDTVIGLYRDSGGSLIEVGCNDDVVSGSVTTSILNANLTAGTVYYIQAGGYGGDSGSLTINVLLTGGATATPTATSTATRTPTPTATSTATSTPTPTATQVVVPVPTPVAPTGTIVATNPTFSWTSSLGQGAWYYLWVSGPNGTALEQWYDGFNICTGSNCAVQPTLNLGGGAYTWWIQAWTQQGGYSAWSAGTAFTVDAPPPVAVPTAPTGTITAPNPTFTWTGVASYSWYYLWVSGPTGTTHAQWYESTTACVGATCSVTPTLNLPGGTYTWWVQLWTPGTGYSPWSDAASFVLALPPVAPTQNAPLGTISSAQPTFIWQTVPAATWYYLWISGPSGYVLDQWYSVAACPGGTCAVTPSLNLANGSYQWWVQAWSPEGGYGAWTSAANFTVSVAPVTGEVPPAPELPVTPPEEQSPVEQPPNSAG